MLPISDQTMQAVEYALRGLERRAGVHADNVANLNTPGYRAGAVDFESVLRGALQNGAPAAAPDAPVGVAMTMPDAQGNTVDLETELVGMMKDNLMRDAMVNAFNFKAGVLRAAIQGR